MRNFLRLALLAVLMIAGPVVASANALATDEDQNVLQADRTLLDAFGKGDAGAADKLLDADFTWIDSQGRSQSRTEVLAKLPAVANADVEPQERTYGSAAVIRANRGRIQVLRVWAKRPAGWRAILYQEVTLAVHSEPTAMSAPGAECDNPCKSIPFQPETQSEKEAIASWQGVMAAMATNDPEAYSPLIADEFTATDTHHDSVLDKPNRLAAMTKQKQSGQRPVPSALLSARMFDFGDSVMMIACEQRPQAKPYFNTRMWTKRDGRWQMVFSFNTRIE